MKNNNPLKVALQKFREAQFRRGAENEYTEVTNLNIGREWQHIGVTNSDRCRRIGNFEKCYVLEYEAKIGEMEKPHKHFNRETGHVLYGEMVITYVEDGKETKITVKEGDNFEFMPNIWHHFNFTKPTSLILSYTPMFDGNWTAEIE